MGWAKTGLGDEAYIKATAGEKRTFEIYFPNPKPEARVFRLNLPSSIRWPTVYLLIPPAALADKAPDKPVTEERFDTVEQEVTRPAGQDWTMVREVNDIAGHKTPYLISMDKMEWLKTGDVRIHLTCWNKSETTVLDRFIVQPTKPLSLLMTEQGQVFPLVGSSLGQHYDNVVVECAPGEKKTFWLEFRGSVPIGKRFLLRLDSPLALPDMPFRLP